SPATTVSGVSLSASGWPGSGKRRGRSWPRISRHLQDRLAGDYRIGRFALRQRLARQRKTARQILATHLPA
ncbi:hypothetical protein CK247_31300, partial [Klebsiella pneumoniae]